MFMSMFILLLYRNADMNGNEKSDRSGFLVLYQLSFSLAVFLTIYFIVLLNEYI